ncbi:hypothetical protein [Micrococcus luteus]|uniref:hypothetical protein n=1 Tax=Micrococcus luteus TaxID=1270 RepID=UPI00080DE23B|nr:hypothetical protein [Micrococcus luteus]
MPQPIAVGAVLGGRYRITQHVVTSADQDMVFLGTDQVLNRRVTVLVASRENATQVASSARELATGERNDDVQVLDLGLSEGRTYLIAGGDPDPDVLLGLAYPQELHVEPFQTDSLGSELFGESRTGDPHAYDDDEAYYTDLDRRLRADEDEAQRRPGFLNRLSERLAERVRPSDGTAAKAAAGASALAAADAATRKQQEERERAEREAAERAERERKEAAERAERERREAEERAEEERRAEAERARRQAEQEAEDRAAREREAEQARLAAEREEAERRELERRAEARRRAEEEQAREAERREAEKRAAAEREAEKREAAEREAEKRAAAERVAQKHGTQAGTAALPAVTAGAAAAQAPNADADGATPPTEPVESVAAEKTDPPEPVAPDTEAIPVRRQRPVPRRAIVAESAPTAHEESRGTAAPVAAGAGVATAAGAAAAGSTAAAAPDAQAAPATTGGDDGATVADPGDGHGRTRGGGPLALLLVLGLLAALVVGGVLLAQNLRGGPAPQAAAASSESASSGPASSGSASSESASDTPSPSESTSPSPTSTSESATAAPKAVQALRSVPDLPEHEAEHDADLPNLIDGDPTTVWRTFAYARPNFGGYVESMNLVVQLEDRTEVNEVTLQSTGATGGAWFAYIADSPEGANAKEIGNGTFDQDTVSIPVPFEGAESEAEYVIVSLTSLPQLEGTTPDLPFGLRLGEITVR